MNHLFDDRDRATRVARMISSFYDDKNVWVNDLFTSNNVCMHTLVVTQGLMLSPSAVPVNHPKTTSAIACEKVLTQAIKDFPHQVHKNNPTILKVYELEQFLESLIDLK